jgi:putative membrane-bound dehydrogenase-like protein
MTQLLNCFALLVLLTGLVLADDEAPITDPAAIDFAAELPRIAPTEPADTIAKFSVMPGFRVELAASEPLLRDPVAIDFDEHGRMFVVEFPEYNQKHARSTIADTGRVRVLSDTDRDGVFDQSEIYVDKLSYPTAVICYDGGVFVGAAPDILYCKDTNGDGRADIRRVVFTGFGQEVQRAGQAQLNSFRWGLDNRIHVCTNFSGGLIQRPDVKNSKPVTVRNRGFSFDPRTLHYEAVSGGGQHGLTIDDWGREFRCRNSDPFKFLVYDERYLARNPWLTAPPPSVNILETGKFTQLFRISPDEPWRVLRTRMRTEKLYAGSNEGGKPSGFFTSATGVTIYRGDAWPAKFRGTGFVGEVANNLIFRAKFEQDGVNLVARRADSDREFLASKDNWFRPVQFANGPDGNLYVVDMYRALIEGASFLPPEVLKHIDVTGGVHRGRIYRIVPEGHSKRSQRFPAKAESRELVRMLEHPNGWHRDTAARLLYTRQDKSVVADIHRQFSESRFPLGRLHALYALDGLQSLDVDVLLQALSDDHSGVREHALKLAEQFAAETPDIQEQIIANSSHSEIRVRFQAAFSLGVVDSDEACAALSRLAVRDGNDPWFRVAVLSSAGGRQAKVFRLLLADQQVRFSQHGRELLTQLGSQIAGAGDVQAVRDLAGEVADLPPAESSLANAVIRRAALDAGSAEVARTLLACGGRTQEIMEAQLTQARRTVTDESKKSAARVSAIRLLSLLDFADVRPIVLQLLDVREDSSVQRAAINMLGRFDQLEVAAIILDRWQRFSPQLRSSAVDTLATRPKWLQAFFDAIERGHIRTGEVDVARIQIFTTHPEASVRQRAVQLFAESRASESRQEIVTRYQPALTIEGHVAHGRAHFRKTCAACHRLEGVGNVVGADLKAIRNRGMPAILLNVLDPNREVKPQYLTYVVIADDGRSHTGMIQSESANSLVLRRPDNTNITILRVNIEEMRSTGISFMPEGLERQLDLQAMADLLAFLGSLK